MNSFTTTPLEILAEFERQTSSKWAVEFVPLDRLRQLEEQAWEENHPAATGFTLQRIWAEGGTLYSSRDNEVIGVREGETEGLATVVARSIEAQSAYAEGVVKGPGEESLY